MSKYSEKTIIEFLTGVLEDKKTWRGIEQEIIDNKEFAKEVAFIRVLLINLDDYVPIQYENLSLNKDESHRLNTIMAEYGFEETLTDFTRKDGVIELRRKIFISIISIAAAIFFILWFRTPNINLNEHLTYELIFFEEGIRGVSNEDLWNSIKNDFKNQKYTQVITNLQNISNDSILIMNSTQINLSTTIAFCYLKLDEIDKAIFYLEKIVSLDNSKEYPSYYYAKYLLAWAYLKSDEQEDLALSYLQSLKNYPPAIKLLKVYLASKN